MTPLGVALPDGGGEVVFAPRVLTFAAEEQARLLGLCRIDPATYGEGVDPASFVEIVAREALLNGVPTSGLVNMGQRIDFRRPVLLGERLQVTGRLIERERNARGVMEASELAFADESGRPVADAVNLALRRLPGGGAAERVASTPFAADGGTPLEVGILREVGAIRLRPADVALYYPSTANPIHYDADAAQAAGFRSPIIGGAHGVRFLTATLWSRRPPTALSMDVSFKRPIFWDDRCSIMGEQEGGAWSRLYLTRDGKVLTELRMNGLAIPSPQT